ncbi:MAG: S9 family peptidase [Anaerococcus sp.]|nr:S9 family peptidase [Anaerococcus sp.]
MKETKLKDILDYEFLSDLEISDDEKFIAYKTTKANEKENTYDSSYWIYDFNLASSYMVSEKASLAGFTKDNKFFFKKDSTDTEDIFYIKDSPGLARKFFSIKKDVSLIRALDEDLFLIKASDKKSKKEKEERKDNDFYKEITSLPFYLNGQGFLEEEKSSFYIYDRNEDKLDLLIESEPYNSLNFLDINWDKKKIIFSKDNYTANKVMEFREDLLLFDIEEKTLKTLIEKEFSLYTARFIEDKIIFVGSKMQKHGINEDALIYLSDYEGSYKKLVDDDFDMAFGNSIGTDARFGGGHIFDTRDDRFYFLVTEYENTKVYSINLKGELREELSKNVEDFILGKDDIYYLTMGPKTLSELMSKNKGLLLENKVKSDICPIETFDFDSNGDKLRGYVLLPKDFDQNKKYPTLLSVHGGPKTEFSDIFHHEHQMLASSGYIIIYTNPHGSSGRGVEFSDIRGKYGDIDYDDLMTFTDRAIEKYPQIDKDKMGIFGGSYGGFMTNFTIGHTHRFKAAVSQRSISNWTSFFGVSDIGYFFANDQTDADMWDSLDKMWDQSPIKYGKNVKTPTLFIHSDEDYRCPLEQGLQMYTRIKLNGVDTKINIFHGENHELSRSGKPKGRIKRLTEIKAWFDKYLKNEN